MSKPARLEKKTPPTPHRSGTSLTFGSIPARLPKTLRSNLLTRSPPALKRSHHLHVIGRGHPRHPPTFDSSSVRCKREYSHATKTTDIICREPLVYRITSIHKHQHDPHDHPHPPTRPHQAHASSTPPCTSTSDRCMYVVLPKDDAPPSSKNDSSNCNTGAIEATMMWLDSE